jgi:hypothetical protein
VVHEHEKDSGSLDYPGVVFCQKLHYWFPKLSTA